MSLLGLLVIAGLGACIGSFLNVVIYRWPLGLSTREPSRSFCPHCETRIAWYDNLPVVSYVLLRGRCRHCAAGISLQYPLVELGTAALFLLIYDGFFVSHVRLGVTHPQSDWPLLLGHWALMAGLMVLTVMDLEAYTVDIRVTWIVSVIGVIAHALWTPVSSLPVREAVTWSTDMEGGGWLRPGSGLTLFCAAVTLGLAVRLIWKGRSAIAGPAPEMAGPETETLTHETEKLKKSSAAGGWVWAIPLTVLLAAYVVNLWQRAMAGEISATLNHGAWYGLGGVLLVSLVVLALAAGHPRPEADQEIDDALQEEAPEARGVAWQELVWLGPAIVLGAAVVVVLCSRFGADVGWRVDRVLHLRWGGEWQPFWGLATGLAGWVIGGLIGWAARLVFTLCLGKEALGLGDVHILAAAGAVAGWQVALLGFFLAAPLALLTVGLNAARRRSRALAYGPWLAFGFLIACLFQDMMLRSLGIRWLLE